MRHPRERNKAVSAAWPRRRVGTALLAAAALAVGVGVPTGVLQTPLYARMTSVQWWNYPVWVLTAILGGLVVATYTRKPSDAVPRSGAGAASGGGLLAAFAVGCPVCNKLVVAVLGVSGATTIWAPFQPVLGGLSIVGLVWVLRRRIRSEYACSIGDAPRDGDMPGDKHDASVRADAPVELPGGG